MTSLATLRQYMSPRDFRALLASRQPPSPASNRQTAEPDTPRAPVASEWKARAPVPRRRIDLNAAPSAMEQTAKGWAEKARGDGVQFHSTDLAQGAQRNHG
jgi:hypothetical protein